MGRVNLLAFSDIHNNVKAVESLRKREKAGFDAIIVAGDMGDDQAEKIFEIISDYDCPVFYVYGNWDNRLPYSKKFAKNCIHLHQTIETVNGYVFTGFSGCKTHWGENPIAEEIFLNVRNDFSLHLQVIDSLREQVNNTAMPFAIEMENAENLYNEYIKSHVPKREKPIDRRREYFDILKTEKLLGNDKMVKRFQKIISLNEKKINSINKPLDRLLASQKHKKYERALDHAHKNAEDENRKIVVEKLKNEGSDFSKVFLIAHERLYKTDIDAPYLFCHLFGHRHGFKHTNYKGTNFINVSVLDDNSSMGAGDGTYCIIKAEGSSLEVCCKSIKDTNL